MIDPTIYNYEQSINRYKREIEYLRGENHRMQHDLYFQERPITPKQDAGDVVGNTFKAAFVFVVGSLLLSAGIAVAWKLNEYLWTLEVL